MTPRIAVLIPVYNRERFVAEAIESVLADDVRDLELILVDDGSTDSTPAILERYAAHDPRIVIVTLSHNQGISHALNAGLSRATAPYIARLDSDDVLVGGRLAAQAAVLDRDSHVVLVSSAYELMDEEGRYLDTWRADEPHEVVRFLLNFYNIIGGGGQVMYRRDAVLAMGGYDVRFSASEDYDLWVRLLRLGTIVTLPQTGMRQRQHGARVTHQYRGRKRSNWIAIMGGALREHLQRAVSDDELDALITVWRMNDQPGRSRTADRVMREAYAVFRTMCRDRAMHAIARRRIARQWLETAASFRRAGNWMEMARYIVRGIGWSPGTALRMLRHW